MNVVEYDFRQPPPSSLESRVRDWLQDYLKQLGRAWPELLSYPASLEVQDVLSLPAIKAFSQVSEMDYAFRLAVTPNDEGECWYLVLSRPLLFALMAGCLSEPLTEMPADRNLTVVQEQIVDVLMRQLFLDAFTITWPFEPRPRPRVLERGLVHMVIGAPTSDLLIALSLIIKLPVGESKVTVFVPRGGLIKELQKAVTKATSNPLQSRDHIANLVQEMAVDVEVELGTIELSFTQLRKLQIGDVLVLDQPVSEPLEASVGGLSKFHVWPGAIGRRQAVQIESPLV